jgi:hypothetical protein
VGFVFCAGVSSQSFSIQSLFRSGSTLKQGLGIFFLPFLHRFSSSNSASIRNLTLQCTLSPFAGCFEVGPCSTYKEQVISANKKKPRVYRFGGRLRRFSQNEEKRQLHLDLSDGIVGEELGILHELGLAEFLELKVWTCRRRGKNSVDKSKRWRNI